MVNKKILILFVLYFLQGIPYGIQAQFLPVFLRQCGTNLTNISLMKILFLPWICKSISAFIFEKFRNKRLWLFYSMVGLTILTFMLSFIDPTNLQMMVVILFIANVCSASHDIAVDGLALRILPTKEIANGNVAQVVGYKVGCIIGGGVLLWFSGFVSWSNLFSGLTILYVCIIITSYWLLPKNAFSKSAKVTEHCHSSTVVYENYEISSGIRYCILQYIVRMLLSWCVKFINFIESPGTKWVMTFVLVYKLGEQACLNMLPLFLIDKGVSAAHIGLWGGLMGDGFSIIGSLFAGWLISSLRLPTYRLLKFLCFLRIIPIYGVTIVVLLWSSFPEYSSLFIVASVACLTLLLFFSGMVTTTTFTFMMHCSQKAPRNSQTLHYAFLSTLEVAGKLTFSMMSGHIVDTIGYFQAFVTFSLLSMTTLPLLGSMPHL